MHWPTLLEVKKYDIFLGKLDGWHTSRVAQSADCVTLEKWINRGYRIATEHQIGTVLHEVYLVKK